ncbi:MAG: hypothetical protein AB7S26_25240 [Sandaracinaceae bacterium]
MTTSAERRGTERDETAPRWTGARWILASTTFVLVACSLVALRASHFAWLERVPSGVDLGLGVAARLTVIGLGLGLVRLVRSDDPIRVRPWPLVRGAFYAFTLFMLALCLAPWDAVLATHAATLIVGLALASTPWVSRLAGRAPGAARWLDLGLGNVCLTLWLLELGLLALSSVSSSPLLAPPERDAGARRGYERYRLEPGSPYIGSLVNEWGDVDDPPRVLASDACSVVMIGDSFSTGIVPHPDHYTTVAEELSGCTIYNMGAPCIGPPEYLYLMRERATLLEPDLVVVALYLYNDIFDVERIEPRRPPWLARDRRATFVVGARLARWWQERARVSSMTTSGLAMRTGPLPGGDEPWFDDPLREPPTFSAATYLSIQTTCAERSETPSVSPWDDFFRTLEAMIDAEGARLRFVLIPGEPQIEDALWEQVVAHASMPLERGYAQRRVGAWLRDRQVPFLDLLPVFAAVPPMEDGNRHLFHLQDTHLNVRGNRVAGEALAAFLAEERP